MFDVEFHAGLESVKIKVKEKDDRIIRKCGMTVACTFDDVIAAGLGDDAKTALRSLRTGGLKKAVLPMDLVEADGTIQCGGKKVRIGSLRGVAATGERGAEPEDEPTIKLEFEFVFSAEAWVFLGENCGAYVAVTLKRRQMSLVNERIA